MKNGKGLRKLEQYANAGKFDPRTVSEMNTNKKKGDPVEHYVLAEITAQVGTQEILNITDDKVQGLCSIHQGILEAGQNVAVEKVIVKVGTHATEVNPLAIDNYDSIRGNVDPALLHGRVEIEQDGKVVFGYEINGLLNDVAPDNNEKEGIELEQPFVLVEGKPIKIRIIYANGLTVGGAKNHIKFLLVGVETSPK